MQSFFQIIFFSSENGISEEQIRPSFLLTVMLNSITSPLSFLHGKKTAFLSSQISFSPLHIYANVLIIQCLVQRTSAWRHASYHNNITLNMLGPQMVYTFEFIILSSPKVTNTNPPKEQNFNSIYFHICGGKYMLSMIIKICTWKISLITIYNIIWVHGYSNSYQKRKKKLCGHRKAKPIFNVMNYIRRRNQIV